MKRQLRRLVFSIMHWLGLPWLSRIAGQKGKVTVLCYHDPRPEVFDAHLRALARRYTFLSLRDFVRGLSSRQTASWPPYGLVITLDDGHAGNVALLEVIRRHRVPVTIFLTSGIVGTRRRFWWTSVESPAERQYLKAMSDVQRSRHLAQRGFRQREDAQSRQALSQADIAEMAATVDFQAHTRFHPILPRCTALRAWEEIQGARDDLVRFFGLDVYAIAYPNGDYSDRDIAYARRAGYACGLTMDEGSNAANTDSYRIRRIAIPDDAGVDEMMVKASGLWAWLRALRNGGQRTGYQPAMVLPSLPPARTGKA